MSQARFDISIPANIQKWYSHFHPSWAERWLSFFSLRFKTNTKISFCCFHAVLGKVIQSRHYAKAALVTRILSWGLRLYLIPEWQPQQTTLVRLLFLNGITLNKNLKIWFLHSQEQHGVLGNSISKPSNFLAAGTMSFICFKEVASINFNKCFSNEWISMWMDKLMWLRSDASNITPKKSFIKAPGGLAGVFMSRYVWKDTIQVIMFWTYGTTNLKTPQTHYKLIYD